MRPGGLFTSALLSLCFFSQVIAAPAHTTSTQTTSTHAPVQVPTASASSCTCLGTTFSSTDVAGAITKAGERAVIRGAKAVRKKGGGYPHQYGGKDPGVSLTSCTGTLLLYPLVQGSVYPGTGEPGGQRVVYQQADNKFCGCITHPSATDGSFDQCT
ncbi:hypothetical protein HYDPIDRAFT_106336 [Hydnomerulius pinastri MD-312]|uniref:Uncharacterized protein n=1 Tax=Hydnomerulius pinastri MD-312 TaxID=994086 RepID=A0A0C9WFN9_9AGAM|nr:hypothetical protein HYDPIDRAFT_110901 [Hydnomerulius pinastri MD-312]KIJ68189.1 hypothetical protein HYDPIDRAFT_106336 [Hydnomerulius pinastri MD-312]